MMTAVVAGQENETTTYAQIEPSLGFVIAGKGNAVSFGSAFCIATVGSNSGLLLTNRHVIAHDRYPRVILMANPNKVLAAAVVRVSQLDAAVLLIPSACAPLQLSSSYPPVGTRIAIAGFPSIQIRAALSGLGLSPSFHEGTISSVLASGSALEYDAQTDHGNSGSPLFDVNTGTVYGLVTWVNTGETGALQNNMAIGILALAPFLQNAHADASYAGEGSGSASSSSSQPRSDNQNNGCLSGLEEFHSALADWSGAFGRYTESSQRTTNAAASATSRLSLTVVQIGAALELKAIRSVINAEEPKLQNADLEIEGSSEPDTSQLTASIVNNIQYLDQYALSWSQSRYYAILAVANGGTPQVDQSAIERIRDLQQQISQQLITLRTSDEICRR